LQQIINSLIHTTWHLLAGLPTRQTLVLYKLLKDRLHFALRRVRHGMEELTAGPLIHVKFHPHWCMGWEWDLSCKFYKMWEMWRDITLAQLLPKISGSVGSYISILIWPHFFSGFQSYGGLTSNGALSSKFSVHPVIW